MAEHVTFWRMKALPGRSEELAALMRDDQGEPDRLRDAGWIATVVGSRKDDPDELWGTVVWDTSDRYYANADSPEQDAWYSKARALLAADPDWYDCDLVDDQRAGASPS